MSSLSHTTARPHKSQTMIMICSIIRVLWLFWTLKLVECRLAGFDGVGGADGNAVPQETRRRRALRERSTKAPKSSTKAPILCTSTKAPGSKSSKAVDCIPPSPAPAPPPEPSCMSGNTGVRQVNPDGSVSMTKVVDLKKGDIVQGIDPFMNPVEDCEVLHIVLWGKGELYGNYTYDHYMLDPSSGGGPAVKQHGKVGDKTIENKYTLLSSCPMVMDESGQFFSPLDGAFSESAVTDWVVYMVIYRGFFRISQALDSRGLQIEPTTLNMDAFPAPPNDTTGVCALTQQMCIEARNHLQTRYELEFRQPARDVIFDFLGFPWPDDPAQIQSNILMLFT